MKSNVCATRGVKHGIRDIQEGRYGEDDADGLRSLAKKLVSASMKKLAPRRKNR
jgi:hypothetical protein